MVLDQGITVEQGQVEVHIVRQVVKRHETRHSVAGNGGLEANHGPKQSLHSDNLLMRYGRTQTSTDDVLIAWQMVPLLSAKMIAVIIIAVIVIKTNWRALG